MSSLFKAPRLEVIAACFDAANAESEMVGLFSLVPAVVDAIRIPVVATGGIADSRGIAAALLLGASAVQIGTGFLRTPEPNIPRAWADALVVTLPEETRVSRVFSGRAGSIRTEYVQAATTDTAPQPAAYPVQRGFTSAMRRQAVQENSIAKMQAWAGQSAMLARDVSAGKLVGDLWAKTMTLLTESSG